MPREHIRYMLFIACEYICDLIYELLATHCIRVTAEEISCEQKTVRNCTKEKKHLILKDHRTNKARTTRYVQIYIFMYVWLNWQRKVVHIHTFCDGRLNNLKYLWQTNRVLNINFNNTLIFSHTHIRPFKHCISYWCIPCYLVLSNRYVHVHFSLFLSLFPCLCDVYVCSMYLIQRLVTLWP